MVEREKRASFAKQATILMAASLFVRFIGFIYRVPLTNLIGDEGNGIYSTGYYIYNFFLVFSSAGLPAAISKMVSERTVLKEYKNAHKVFQVSLILTLIGGTVGALVMWLGADFFSNLVNMPESRFSIITLAPTVLIVAIMSSFRGYFQGLKTTIPTAISQIIEQIFHAIASVLLAFIIIKAMSKDITPSTEVLAYAAAGGTAGTGIGAFFGLLFLIFAYFLIKPSINKKFRKDVNSEEESSTYIAKNMMKLSIAIVAGTAIMSVTNVIDMKMVNSLLLGTERYSAIEVRQLYGQLTGKYSTLTTLPVALSTAFATVIVPNIASSVVLKDRAAVKRKINTALKLTMLISIPAAIGIGILGSHILLLLFPSYSEGGRLLTVGAVSIIFLSLAQINTGILQGIDKAHFPIIAIAIGALVKIILNWIFIPREGIDVVGSVIGTIGCYVVASLLDLWALKQYTRIRFDINNIFIKPLIAGVGMGIICFGSYSLIMLPSSAETEKLFNAIATITSVILSILVYVLILLLIKGIKKEDIELFPFGKNISKLLTKFNLI